MLLLVKVRLLHQERKKVGQELKKKNLKSYNSISPLVLQSLQYIIQ